MHLEAFRCRFGKGWYISEHDFPSTGRSDFAEKIGKTSLPIVGSELLRACGRWVFVITLLRNQEQVWFEVSYDVDNPLVPLRARKIGLVG